MRWYVKNTFKIVKQTIADFSSYNIFTMSAALAYYTVFALAPMIIVIMRICDLFFGKEAIEGRIYFEIKSFVGSEAAVQIQELIKNASTAPNSTLASIIGVVTLVIGATGIFTQIQDSINHIWRLKAKPKKGWLKMIINRLLSFSMLVSLGFILMVSLIANALLEAFSQKLTQIFPSVTVYVAYTANLLLTFLGISLLFAIIFKVLPDAKIKWADVRVGAITTSLLFMIGKWAITLYLTRSHIGTSYGAAGSIVIILVWVYYSAIILYFGAAYTKIHAQFRGRHIYPNEYAVWIQQVEMESKSSLQAQPETIEERKKLAT